MHRSSFSLLILTVATLSTAAAHAQECPAGQAISADTAGHCCWPQQAWSTTRSACVGIPACPPGTRAEGDTCVAGCPAGQSMSADTAGHCCWPGQVWSSTRSQCVGIPQCGAGLVAQGEACVAAQSMCAPGQVTSDETQGHCCWPGQVWSSLRSTCVGAVQCPAGLVAAGESCVAAGPAPSSSTPTQLGPPGAMVAAPPAAGAAGGGAIVHVPGPDGVEVAADQDGHWTCTAPCTLELRPGTVRFGARGVRGARELSVAAGMQELAIEPGGSMGEAIFGFVLAGIGISAVGLGFWLFVPAEEARVACNSLGYYCDLSDEGYGGIVAIVLGGLAVVLGLGGGIGNLGSGSMVMRSARTLTSREPVRVGLTPNGLSVRWM